MFLINENIIASRTFYVTVVLMNSYPYSCIRLETFLCDF